MIMRVTAFEVWEFSTFYCKYMIKNNLNNYYWRLLEKYYVVLEQLWDKCRSKKISIIS